jgi:hypothetical protein
MIDTRITPEEKSRENRLCAAKVEAILKAESRKVREVKR